MRIPSVPAALAAGLCLAGVGNQADAACCYFSAKNADILQPAQKVFLSYDPAEKVETFTVQPKFEGNSLDFGMVIPTPTQPKLHEMPKEFFKHLAVYTILKKRESPQSKLLFRDLDRFQALNMTYFDRDGKQTAQGKDKSAARPKVVILEAGVVGSLDYKIITADRADDLFQWLKENKYSYSGDEATLDHYVKQKWIFTVMKIDTAAMKKNRDGTFSGEVTPTRFQFTSEKFVYPLKITQISVKDKFGTARWVGPGPTFAARGERFDSLGGLSNLKDFCARALQGGKKVKPRGILLLGVPGTGKSAFCKALGNETGRPTLLLDVGALMGSLVGQSEQNIRQALKIADAMSPCILFVDEIEKALSGVGGSGDSGVSSRLFGTLLSWLSDHISDVFFVGTSNDISKLPPEFARAERFDALYFLDLPTSQEKDAIWRLYRQNFEIAESQARPDDTDWTGAEIKSCCRLSALLDVPLTQAARNVVPVARTAAESMEKLRNWASGRCLAASNSGIYERPGSQQTQPKARRRVQREPENN